ncbi:MAG: sulfite exporter TauE/SafE family protein [bacterium]|jgi:uncharacterized membrane protein YfcA
MTEIFSLLPPSEWGYVLIASFIIGLGKAGLRGLDMLSVTMMAFVFGTKSSTGVVLPLLCLADIAAVKYYNRHANWSHFWKLIPWMAVGVLIGVFVGKDLNEIIFRKFMAIIVLLTIIIVLIMEFRKSEEVPSNKLFSVTTGLSAGFTTMIGNLAGAFSNLYFLAMRVGKNSFIGTAAWIFLVINLFKLPFQIFYWKNITADTLKIDALLIPTLLLGFGLGVMIVSRIKDHHYRRLIIVLTIIGSVFMLLKQ